MSTPDRTTTVTRRSALRTGGLAAIMAGLLGTTTHAAPVAAEAQPALPLIDQAEAMLVELQSIMLRLDERGRLNLGANLENIARLGEVREDLIPGTLVDYPLMISPGNRMCDLMDAEDEAARRAAITHAAVVAQYAAARAAGDAAGDRDVGTKIRRELAEAYGEDLGYAIDGAAFTLYLEQRHGTAA